MNTDNVFDNNVGNQKQGDEWFDSNEEEDGKKLHWYQKLFYRLLGTASIAMIVAYGQKKERERNRLKFWRPTHHQGLFYNTTSWELRRKPLSDDELKALGY